MSVRNKLCLGTILNLLFDTSFAVLNQKRDGKKRTTVGVWMAANQAKNILVFNIEGADCGGRGDRREVSKYLFLIFFRRVIEFSLYLDL